MQQVGKGKGVDQVRVLADARLAQVVYLGPGWVAPVRYVDAGSRGAKVDLGGLFLGPRAQREAQSFACGQLGRGKAAVVELVKDQPDFAPGGGNWKARMRTWITPI